MTAEAERDDHIDIAHVLFIDIVGYSKLLANEQKQVVASLTDAVRRTAEFQHAEAKGQLLRIPTGDGIALVFFGGADAPARCAIELAKALQEQANFQVRMGINSGPIDHLSDVNDLPNISGPAINMAQRVMNCGDAGHILLSKRLAEDLSQYAKWRPHLHDLGEAEVKHGTRVGIVNLCVDGAGNPAMPEQLRRENQNEKALRRRRRLIIILVLAMAAVAGGLALYRTTTRRGGGPNEPEKSIAVLPFENLSAHPDNAFFADGVQDEVLTDLARIADLKVISRTSVMQYKTGARRNVREIGRELGVAHLVEGSVQRSADRVRVNAQLVDARTDAHLWAQTYDGSLADVFAIQSQIAKAIATQLAARLSPHEKKAIEQQPTTDIAAFELYSRAKDLILDAARLISAKKERETAITLLDQALQRDRSFFDAQCLLAYGHDMLYLLGLDRTPERLALAQSAVETAARLRPDAGETHLARAVHLYCARLDYAQALIELEVARKTLPNDSRVDELTGYINRRQGRHEEGLRNLQAALQLDPRNYQIVTQLAVSYDMMRRYRQELEMWDRALSIEPDRLDAKVTRANVSLDWKADTRPLHQLLEQIRAQQPKAIEDVADSWFGCALAERDAAAAEAAIAAIGDGDVILLDALRMGRHYGEGLVARMAGDEARARTAFTAARVEQEKGVNEQPDYAPALCVLGLIDAALGQKEEALRKGRRAMELLPVSKDSINGVHMIEYFAITAGWVGEKQLALDNLAVAARLPLGPTYGELKLRPEWDPLRNEPRFHEILTSLAPKD